MGLVWLALAVGQAGGDKLKEEYYQDFRGKVLPPVFRPFGSQADKFVGTDALGLRINLPAKRKQLFPVGVLTAFGVGGDFVITAGYEVRQAEVPDGGFGVGAILNVKKAGSPEAATLGWVVRGPKTEVLVWDRSVAGAEKKLKFRGGVEPSAARAGRLRLEREGPKLRYLFAKGTEDNFRQVHEEADFGSGDLAHVQLAAVTGRKPLAVDVRFKDLRIRAESLPGVPGIPAAGGWWRWWLGALLVMPLLGGVYWAWRRWWANQTAESSARPAPRPRLPKTPQS